jgi:DNA-binding CsgD family transcriptional regulator
MQARAEVSLTKAEAEMICSMLREGSSLQEVCDLCAVEPSTVKEAVVRVTNLTRMQVEAVLRLQAKGNSARDIARITSLSPEVLQLFLPLNEVTRTNTFTPEIIYTSKGNTGQLKWSNMRTGSQGSFTIPGFGFQNWSFLLELPGEVLFLTGGFPRGNEVVSIEVKRDFSVKLMTSMITGRFHHASSYFKGVVYAFGGNQTQTCERFSCSAKVWESLSDKPIRATCQGVVTIESTGCIYLLGGNISNEENSTKIEEFNTTTGNWRVLGVDLHIADHFIACFSISPSSIYYAKGYQLYKLCLRTEQQEEVTTLKPFVYNCYSVCYYRDGTLWAKDECDLEGHPIGPLS